MPPIPGGCTRPDFPKDPMPRTRKLLLTTLAVGATSAVAGLGVFAAFTAQTFNTGNSIGSGTVQITDNDGGLALYNVSNRGPGQSTVSCIKVEYTGSLASTVKLFRSGAISNGSAFNLRIERGSGVTGGFGSCAGFANAVDVYNGPLGNLPADYATAPDARGSAWNQGDIVDYRVTATVVDDPSPGSHATPLSSGTHQLVWEARNN